MRLNCAHRTYGPMVNVEELDPEPFIAILDQIGLPTKFKEICPHSNQSFNGAVSDLEQELAASTAIVTVSAANPMIALAPSKQNLTTDIDIKPETGIPTNQRKLTK